MAVLGAIHNLSFYHSEINGEHRPPQQPQQPQQPQHHHKPAKSVQHSGKHQSHCVDSLTAKTADISGVLCAIYQWSAQPIQAEIARVLGNLTRSMDARQAVQAAGGLQFLLENVSSADVDMVATSCGVLVNMLGDWQRRTIFRDLNGPVLLRDVLQRSAGQQNWILALIVCQVSHASLCVCVCANFLFTHTCTRQMWGDFLLSIHLRLVLLLPRPFMKLRNWVNNIFFRFIRCVGFVELHNWFRKRCRSTGRTRGWLHFQRYFGIFGYVD